MIGGVPVVNAADVGPDGIVSPSPGVRVSPEIAKRLPRYRLEPGDIVLVRIGVTTRRAMATEPQGGWLLSGSCIRVRAVRDVSPEYLACYLAHPAAQEWLAEHTKRGVLPTLSGRTVGALPLVLPPAAVQQRVVEVARIMDAKIHAHENVIRTTQALRELLLPRLLAGDPAPPGPER
jgi:restriction endonuclease S subunit